MVTLLQVMGQDGNIVQFKIKKHTALKKLMATYCERAGLALQTIRFSFDGTRINESDTPKVGVNNRFPSRTCYVGPAD